MHGSPAVRRLRRCVLALITAGLVATGAAAGPWAPPGDARMRTDVELLAAHGYIIGPVNAWPLPWGQIDHGLARAREANGLAPDVLAAVGRLETLSEMNRRATNFTVRAQATNSASLVRGFDRVARNPGDVTVAAAHDLGRLHVQWGATWISDGTPGQRATRFQNGFSPDPSFAALRMGNWALYGGWIDTWWGAGRDGSLLFSTSARPFPKVGIRRLQPYSIDFPVLRWLGPVSFDMFAGVVTEKRDFDNPGVIGMRLAFQPTRYFEIGLNRGLMLCGSGRPCDLRIIGQALLGIGDFDNTGTFDEPGNQIAGFDMAYRRPIGTSGDVLKLHFEAIAEDADNILIEQFARQIGAGVSGPLGSGGALYDAGLEYTDTQGSLLLAPLRIGWKTANEVFPGSVYNHFIYTDGWTYGRRPIGYSLDGDARAMTVHVAITDERNRRWHLSARNILLNMNEFDSYRVSKTRERIGVLTGGVNWPTRMGDVRAEVRLQHGAPDTPDRNPTLVQGEIGWTTRF
jgi:hypothetical protein